MEDSPRELQPGDALGRYDILMRVADGGMASVWAARMHGSRGFQKVVAIKTLLSALSDDSDFEGMLLDEARLASRIRHPHVVEILDVGENTGMLYIVMEWVHGPTLAMINRLAKLRGGVPLPVALKICSDAASGLHAAHELRNESGELVELVHRDISPQNVMVSFNGIVKIVDFGVAKAADRLSDTGAGGAVKGKVPYMSPEQLQGRALDRRSDIFSLGALMYVLATGRHPFRGASDEITIENIQTRAAASPREIAPHLPSEFEAIIMKAIEKRPEDRWQTCGELQRALDQLMQQQGMLVSHTDVEAFVQDVAAEVLGDQDERLREAIAAADANLSIRPSDVEVIPSQPPAADPNEATQESEYRAEERKRRVIIAGLAATTVLGASLVGMSIVNRSGSSEGTPAVVASATSSIAKSSALPAPSLSSAPATAAMSTSVPASTASAEPPVLELDADDPSMAPAGGKTERTSSGGTKNRESVAAGASATPHASSTPAAGATTSEPVATTKPTSAPKSRHPKSSGGLKSVTDSQPDF